MICVPRVFKVALTLASAFCVGCGSSSHSGGPTAQSVPFVATTTLEALTVNNTSASASFSALPDGDATPGNVSKISVKNLLPAGYSGKVLAHWMPWWSCTTTPCDGIHDTNTQVEVHYSTEDPAQIDAVIEDMISRGYDGVVVAQSNSVGVEKTSTVAMAGEMPKFSNFLFSVAENGLNTISTASAQLTQLETDMAFANTNYFSLGNYLKIGGRPVVYIFDAGSIDWTTAAASCDGNPLFIMNGPSNASSTLGGFFWFGTLAMNTDITGSAEINVLDSFLTTVAANPGFLYSGSFFKGFNDSLAPWGEGRIVDQDCGLTFVNSIGAVGTYLSASSGDLPVLQVATWDDYEEGTEVETGINNCGSIAARVSGTVVTPVPTFSGEGSELTVDHYEIYLSTDGVHLMDVGSAATGGGSLDLASLGLPSATYSVYAQMTGKSHIINQVSSPSTVTLPRL